MVDVDRSSASQQTRVGAGAFGGYSRKAACLCALLPAASLIRGRICVQRSRHQWRADRVGARFRWGGKREADAFVFRSQSVVTGTGVPPPAIEGVRDAYWGRRNCARACTPDFRYASSSFAVSCGTGKNSLRCFAASVARSGTHTESLVVAERTKTRAATNAASGAFFFSGSSTIVSLSCARAPGAKTLPAPAAIMRPRNSAPDASRNTQTI